MEAELKGEEHILILLKKMSTVDFPSGEEMSMNNVDLESNNVGVQPLRNEVEENRIESSEERRDEVQAHGWRLLPKETYISIKQNDESWREIIDQSLQQESPKGNTVLHIAALYGNHSCVERILQIGGAELLTAKNTNGDTPLHVAARAVEISALRNLLNAVLRNPNSEQAKEAILVTNNQGNTFFHEAFLNGHKDVMRILDSSPDFRNLVEENAFILKNKEGKSVLHLAFEKGYEDIVDVVLTRIIPHNEGTKLLHTFKLPPITFFFSILFFL